MLDVLDEFGSADIAEAVIVFSREAGLTARDTAAIEAFRADVAKDPPKQTGSPSQPILSQDGKAAIVIAPVDVPEGESDILTDAVDDLRGRLADAPAGLQTAVTGPAGFSADAIKVFNGINSTLLFATAGLVFVLLVLIYRSPIFWFLPLLAVAFAEVTVRAIGYGLASAGVVVNGQTAGILLVLVFGAGTDYALLLTARYREELRRHRDKHEAMGLALRRGRPRDPGLGGHQHLRAAGAGAGGGERHGGPRAGRRDGRGGGDGRDAHRPAGAPHHRRPAGVLAVRPAVPGGRDGGAGGARPLAPPGRPDLRVAAADLDRDAGGAPRPGARHARVRQGHHPAGGLPRRRRVGHRPGTAGRVVPGRLRGADGRDRPRPGARGRGDAGAPGAAGGVVGAAAGEGAPGVRLAATLVPDPYSSEAIDLVPHLREVAKAAGGDETLVGGPSAITYDLNQAAQHDLIVLPPLVLLVILVIIGILLRAIVAPLLIVGTVIVSFLASLGASVLIFDYVFDFPGQDPSLPLFGFIFLVALGVDYNIFLMARVREESIHHGTREGMIRGLAVTGAVITSAGIVLAGTFWCWRCCRW